MTAADDIRELLDGWDMLEAWARVEFPHADDEELYQITKRAMDDLLGLA